MTQICFEDHVGTIWSLAYKYSNWWVTPEDLFGIGQEVFLTTSKKFDPSRGVKFNTYFHNALNRHFFNEVTRPTSVPGANVPSSVVPDFTRRLEFFSLIDSLSEEAREVWQVILDAPAEATKTEISYCDKNPVWAQAGIKNMLVKKGWAQRAIDQAFGELREAVSALNG